jgi:uncharacterized membrane protein YgaE (UPF0421/DUF939 family)
MGAVALLTSLMAAAAPLGGVLGFLLSLGYMLVATMARVANLFELVSLRWAAAHIAVGCVAGLIVVFAGTGALTTIGSVLMAGAPTGAIGDSAGRRLLDTILGCAVALLFTYLLWPRDSESEETAAVPAPT